jgi:hypothetical protein
MGDKCLFVLTDIIKSNRVMEWHDIERAALWVIWEGIDKKLKNTMLKSPRNFSLVCGAVHSARQAAVERVEKWIKWDSVGN